MAISSLIKGAIKGVENLAPKDFPKALDEIAEVPEENFKAALKSTKEATPSSTAVMQEHVDAIENMSNEDFQQFLKGFDEKFPNPPGERFDEAFPDPPPPLAEVEELENVSDEDFSKILKEFQESAPVSPGSPFGKKLETNDIFSDEETSEAGFFLIESIPVSGDDLSVLTDEQVVTAANQLKTGLLSPDEVIESIKNPSVSSLDDDFADFESAADAIENKLKAALGGTEEGVTVPFTQLIPQAEKVLFDNLSDFQVQALSDSDKIKAANQISGLADDDNVSLTLAQNAERIDLDEIVRDLESEPSSTASSAVLGAAKINEDVAKTLISIRKSSIVTRAPRKIRLRLEDIERSAPGDIFIEEIRRNIDDDYLDIAKSMNNLELGVVNFYTSRGDLALNWGLRNGEVTPGSPLDKTVTFLNETLEKLPAYKDVAYRSVAKRMFDRYEVGEVVEEIGFTSFTTNPLGGKFSPGKPRQTTTFVIQSESGRYIEPFTEWDGESEVLFKSGTRFRVVDKDEDTGQIFLEEAN